MRAILIALACLAIASGTVAAGALGADTKPLVLLVGRAPLTVSGSHFGPGERVVVTLVRTTPRAQRVVVDRRGRFFVSFAGVRVERCSSVFVTVLSQRGTTRLIGGTPNCKSSARNA